MKLEQQVTSPSKTVQEREKELTELLPKLEISRFTNWPGQIKSHNRSTAIAMLESVKKMVHGFLRTHDSHKWTGGYDLGCPICASNKPFERLYTRLDEEIKLINSPD